MPQQTHLVQLQHPDHGRAMARVDGSRLLLRDGPTTVYDLAWQACLEGISLREAMEREIGDRVLDYDAVYNGQSQWRLMPPIDHPGTPSRCLISGTGLSHLKSAQTRDNMHTGAVTVTDSMKMYQSGVDGGKPEPGRVGAAPEWFFKGDGGIVRAQDEPLDVPEFAGDGGDEAEIAGVYLIDQYGVPRRLGFTAGNEFSDHEIEKRNYLYLAHSKLRTCSLGPELVNDGPFDSVPGRACILRGGSVLWERAFLTGEQNMCHSLANLEHHHFKYEQHRRPGDIHVHFFGAAAFSSADGVQVQDGDVMEIALEGYGRPLRNPVRVAPKSERLVEAKPL
jgi:hypothetical protein